MKRFILPACAILVATGSAFATQNAKIKDRKLLDRQAYIYNFTTNECDPKIICSTEGSQICTVNGEDNAQEAFGTDGPQVDHPLTCDVTLNRKVN